MDDSHRMRRTAWHNVPLSRGRTVLAESNHRFSSTWSSLPGTLGGLWTHHGSGADWTDGIDRQHDLRRAARPSFGHPRLRGILNHVEAGVTAVYIGICDREKRSHSAEVGGTARRDREGRQAATGKLGPWSWAGCHREADDHGLIRARGGDTILGEMAHRSRRRVTPGQPVGG